MFIAPKKFTLIGLGLIAILTSCNSVAKTPTATIKTQNLTPTPIKITLSDLPQPYATESASHSPKV
ncbi:MAG: hypothetical protein RLZZ574_727, partial [Cyanobacteriota bacterium]